MVKTSGLVPVNVVAEQLGCSERHVRRLVEQGEIDGVRIGKRALRVKRESVGKYLDKRNCEDE